MPAKFHSTDLAVQIVGRGLKTLAEQCAIRVPD